MRSNLLRYTFVFLFSLAALPSFGQVQWTNADSLYQPLPGGIHIFFTNDSLDSKPNRAFYVSVALKDKSLDFATDTTFRRRLTPSQYFERNQEPLLVVNATFFSPTSRNLNIVMNNGQLLSYNVPSVFDKADSLYHYLTRSAMGLDSKRRADAAWVFTDTVQNRVLEFSAPVVAKGKNAYPSIDQLNCKDCKVRPWKMKTAVGGGPMLVSDGVITITNEQERMFAGVRLAEKHPRTAMGHTRDGRLIIMAIEGRNPGNAEGATLLQEASMLRDVGCMEALNLDGGGSTCLLINGKETITPSDKTGQRAVPVVFMVLAKH